MGETERRFLQRLRESQPHGLPQSQTPARCRPLVESLRTCGALDLKPTAQGILLRICNHGAFQDFLDARCPGGLYVSIDEIEDRSAAVAAFGDAKALRRGPCEGVFIRSIKPNVMIVAGDGGAIPVTDLTRLAGGAALLLSDESQWSFAGTVAVVENAEAFWRHERVLAEVDLAVFACGKMSGRLVDWLASDFMGDCQITHWGDYDPIGVAEYVRLAQSCPGRVTSYAPPEVTDLLPKFGKRELITDQSAHLDRLRNKLQDPIVHRMVDLFDRHRRGLEQEILLKPI
jgi:hypothetical protein